MPYLMLVLFRLNIVGNQLNYISDETFGVFELCKFHYAFHSKSGVLDA